MGGPVGHLPAANAGLRGHFLPLGEVRVGPEGAEDFVSP